MLTKHKRFPMQKPWRVRAERTKWPDLLRISTEWEPTTILRMISKRSMWLPSNIRLCLRWWLLRHFWTRWRHREWAVQAVWLACLEVDIDWRWRSRNLTEGSERHTSSSRRCFDEWSASRRVCWSCSCLTLWLLEFSWHCLLHKYCRSYRIPLSEDLGSLCESLRCRRWCKTDLEYCVRVSNLKQLKKANNFNLQEIRQRVQRWVRT